MLSDDEKKRILGCLKQFEGKEGEVRLMLKAGKWSNMYENAFVHEWLDERKEKKELEKFPFKPDKVTEIITHCFEYDELETNKQINQLMGLMFEFPERKFYLYKESSKSLPRVVLSAKEQNMLCIDEVESFYYKHPKNKKDYVKISGNNPSFDWERAVIEKGPEYNRYTLKLTQKAQRDLEISYSEYKRKQMVENPLELKPNLFGIGLDLMKAWGHVKKWVKREPKS